MKQLFITALLFIACLQSFSQAAGNSVYGNAQRMNNSQYGSTPANGVDLNLTNNNYSFSNFLEANVMINVKAVGYVAIFSLTQHGKTIEETEGMMHMRTDLFTKQLQQEGIDPHQVFIDPVSLIPTYEIEVADKKLSKTFNEVPSGFEIKKNIHITFKNQEMINNLIAIAAHAEIYDMVKVEYAIDNMDEVLERLRIEALRILKNKKEVMENTGMHTRFMQVGEKYGSVYPPERYSEYYAYKTGAAPSYLVSYKKGLPQQSVQYNYAEKNKTIYYDKVSDKQFDKVINPVVGEPMVQVYLSLKAQLEKYDPETEAADKAYNLKLRQIQLKEMELKIEMRRKGIVMKVKEDVQ